MTSHEWYVRGDGNVRGPLSGRELRTWARDGRVTPATDVGPSATGPWRKADRVRGLFAAAAEVPAAPPGDPADRAWYVGREGAVYGPFTARELQARVGVVGDRPAGRDRGVGASPPRRVLSALGIVLCLAILEALATVGGREALPAEW